MGRRGMSSQITAARIVKTIWQNPRISRVEIADHLGLDKSTVTNQMAKLLEAGLVSEVEEGSAGARGGRRPIFLSVCPDFGAVIGIELKIDSYCAVAVNLGGKVLSSTRGVLPSGLSLENPDLLAEVVAKCGEKLLPRSSRLLGIGFGAGGLIDQRSGRILYSLPLGISKAVDFSAAMAARLGTSCVIENDANCCAWGELTRHRSEALRDFLFVLLELRRDRISMERFGGMGVGFGIVLGGKVHSGAHGSAGEFRSVFCRAQGSLQLSSGLSSLPLSGQEAEDLDKSSDELARNIAMMVNTMDFKQVFVGGDVEAFGKDFAGNLDRRLKENWMYPMPKEVRIETSSFGEKAVAYGAAGLMMNKLMSDLDLPMLDIPAGRKSPRSCAVRN